MIGIKGTGIYLPDRRHSNFDRLEKFDMTEHEPGTEQRCDTFK